MVVETLFLSSGLIIAALLGAKILEDKTKKKTLLLRLVSLSDERVRSVSREFANLYSHLKERTIFFVTKQLPMRSRNLLNKTGSVIKEKAEKHVGARLRREEGISEYFKNLSEKENSGKAGEVQEEGK